MNLWKIPLTARMARDSKGFQTWKTEAVNERSQEDEKQLYTTAGVTDNIHCSFILLPFLGFFGFVVLVVVLRADLRMLKETYHYFTFPGVPCTLKGTCGN